MKPEIREPQDGGCWYCMTVDDDLEFCCEFDCYVHHECVEQRLKDNPNDREAKIILAEVVSGANNDH